MKLPVPQTNNKSQRTSVGHPSPTKPDTIGPAANQKVEFRSKSAVKPERAVHIEPLVGKSTIAGRKRIRSRGAVAANAALTKKFGTVGPTIFVEQQVPPNTEMAIARGTAGPSGQRFPRPRLPPVVYDQLDVMLRKSVTKFARETDFVPTVAHALQVSEGLKFTVATIATAGQLKQPLDGQLKSGFLSLISGLFRVLTVDKGSRVAKLRKLSGMSDAKAHLLLDTCADTILSEIASRDSNSPEPVGAVETSTSRRSSERSLTHLQFELVTITLHLGDNAYANAIVRELDRRRSHSHAQGYVHALLTRLVAKGFLSTGPRVSAIGSDGRSRSVVVYNVTAVGRSQLERSARFFSETRP